MDLKDKVWLVLLKNSISYNRKSISCINAETFFIDIFLCKSKPILTGILYRPLINKTL